MIRDISLFAEVCSLFCQIMRPLADIRLDIDQNPSLEIFSDPALTAFGFDGDAVASGQRLVLRLTQEAICIVSFCCSQKIPELGYCRARQHVNASSKRARYFPGSCWVGESRAERKAHRKPLKIFGRYCVGSTAPALDKCSHDLFNPAWELLSQNASGK